MLGFSFSNSLVNLTNSFCCAPCIPCQKVIVVFLLILAGILALDALLLLFEEHADKPATAKPSISPALANLITFSIFLFISQRNPFFFSTTYCIFNIHLLQYIV